MLDSHHLNTVGLPALTCYFLCDPYEELDKREARKARRHELNDNDCPMSPEVTGLSAALHAYGTLGFRVDGRWQHPLACTPEKAKVRIVGAG